MFKTLRRILSGDGDTRLDNGNNENTELEAEYRQRISRRSLKRQTGHVWNAHYDPPPMERLLRKFTSRAEKDARIQEGESKARQRNTLISGLSKSEVYRKVVVPFFQSIEGDAYSKIRKPSSVRSDLEREMSYDYYIGKQEGRLEVIEDFRLMVTVAIHELAQDRAKAMLREKKNATSKQTE